MQLMGGRMMGGMGMQHGADSATAAPEPRRQLMESRVAMLQMMMEQVMPQMPADALGPEALNDDEPSRLRGLVSIQRT